MRKTHGKVIMRMLAVLLCCVFFLCSCSLLDAFTVDSSTSGSASLSGSVAQSGSGADSEEYNIFGDDGTTLYRPETEPQALSVCMVNVETGITVYEKDADMQLPAASLVKMMTCILIMEQVEKFGWDLDTTIVDSTGKSWVYDALYGQNASNADIRLGEALPLRELLYAMLLPSANEAALLTADFACTGYMQNFLYMMNTRAETLGCTNTHFVDVNGLSPDSVTTARDMTLIVKAFFENPVLAEIAATTSFEIPAHEKHYSPYYVHTTNRLLVGTSPYAKLLGSAAGALLGGKTGSLGDWQNFASMATKNGETYACVVMQSPNTADTVAPTIEGETPAPARPALVESAMLYDWAFTNLGVRSVLDVTEAVTEMRVRYSSDTNIVRLLPLDDIKAVLPREADTKAISRIYDMPEQIDAPVQKGSVIGSVQLMLGGATIGSVQLVAAEDVQRNPTLFMMNEVGNFFSGTYFRVLVVLVISAAVLYGFGIFLVANSRARKRKSAAVSGGAKPPQKTETQPQNRRRM